LGFSALPSKIDAAFEGTERSEMDHLNTEENLVNQPLIRALFKSDIPFSTRKGEENPVFLLAPTRCSIWFQEEKSADMTENVILVNFQEVRKEWFLYYHNG
jgi:hypothetical protein